MMHSYSVDASRWKVAVYIGITAVFIGVGIEVLLTDWIGVDAWGLSPFLLGVTIYLLFDRWLWRYPPFSWAHSVPDLSGSWGGEVMSSFSVEDVGDNLTKIDSSGSRLEITQRWSKIEIRYRNPDSSHSRSVAAHLETKTSEPRLTYVYQNEPEGNGVSTEQSKHEGTAKLRLLEDKPELELRGTYYTDQGGGQTYGTMKFEEMSS